MSANLNNDDDDDDDTDTDIDDDVAAPAAVAALVADATDRREENESMEVSIPLQDLSVEEGSTARVPRNADAVGTR